MFVAAIVISSISIVLAVILLIATTVADTIGPWNFLGTVFSITLAIVSLCSLEAEALAFYLSLAAIVVLIVGHLIEFGTNSYRVTSEADYFD